MCFVGVKVDAPPGWLERVQAYMKEMPGKVKELEDLLVQNDIVRARMINVGVLPKARALSYGITGPMGRASGIGFDLRRYAPYSVYDKFDFDVPVADTGDVYARLLVRLQEILQCGKIVEQAVRSMPQGAIVDPKFEGSKQLRVKPRKGESYTRIESAKGELGYYIVSDGSMKPYRVRIRGPSFVNLAPLREMSVGSKIPDLIATLGSIDIVLGDVDR